ncbi:MAG TPA: hypothetical protein VF294_12780 [Polyangiaceae bacterium]
MSRALACLGAIGLVSFSAAGARARSSDFSVSLEYAAPAGCPDTAALEALVSARLGYEPFAEAAPNHLAVRITPRGTSLEGQIEWRDASGKWAGDQAFRVGSGECRGLTRTIALALAVQIQLLADAGTPPHADTATAPEPAPSAGEQSAPSTTASPPPATPPTKPTPEETRQSGASDPSRSQPESPARERGARPAFAMGVGTSVALGMSSSPVLLERVFGSLAGELLSVELGAEVSLPATTRRADGAGFSQQALLGTSAGCAALKPWFLCVVASAGEIRMGGKDVDHPSSGSVPVFDAGLRVSFTQALSRRFFLTARAAGLIHVTRWTARLDEVPVWTAPRFGAAGGIDVGVNIF